MTPGPTLAQTESLLNLAINSSVACHAKTELRPGLELKLGFCGTWEVKSRVRVSLAPNTFHFQGCISVLGNRLATCHRDALLAHCRPAADDNGLASNALCDTLPVAQYA